MSPFNLADYEPVEERLARFWADHPNGRISTEIVNGTHSGESVVMKASVWKGWPERPNGIVTKLGEGESFHPLPQPFRDVEPDATGHAQETPGSNPVNKTSWIENCETSAIGRALANMGYAPKGSRPSREEMAKAAAPRSKPGSPSARAGIRTKLRASQINLLQAAKDAQVDDDLRHRISLMLTGTASVKEMTDDEADKVTKNLAWFSLNREAGLRELEAWERGS